MDNETLKTILQLKEENVNLKRAIMDATVMLAGMINDRISDFDDSATEGLFREVRKTLSDEKR